LRLRDILAAFRVGRGKLSNASSCPGSATPAAAAAAAAAAVAASRDDEDAFIEGVRAVGLRSLCFGAHTTLPKPLTQPLTLPFNLNLERQPSTFGGCVTFAAGAPVRRAAAAVRHAPR
jgi:hypothetical protein